MPYVEDRIVHDADSHVMETPHWLFPWADPGVRERMKPIFLNRVKPDEETLHRPLPLCGLRSRGWQATGAARYTRLMSDDAYQATVPAVAAGRAAVVARLRVLARGLDKHPLDVAAEVLVLIDPALGVFERRAALRRPESSPE
jgi:hypothetical protein